MTTDLPTPAEELPYDAVAMLTMLDRHRVEYVLIGGLAAAVHGCVTPDTTVAVVPARFSRNRDRLTRALGALHATSRQASSGSRPGQTRMRTHLGALEVDYEPPGTAGHLDLYDSARRFVLGPALTVEVACPADLLRIAEMRRSPADEASLPSLREAVERAPSTLDIPALDGAQIAASQGPEAGDAAPAPDAADASPQQAAGAPAGAPPAATPASTPST